MRLLSSLTNPGPDAPAPPEDLILAAEAAGAAAETTAQAAAAYQTFAPQLGPYRPDVRLMTACATMLEKQRRSEGMLAIWADLLGLFPQDPTIVRMLMRWFRRGRQIEEGLQRLHQIVPDAHLGPAEADLRLTGYQELNAFAEIDRLMAEVLPRFPESRSLRVKYLQALMKQGRFLEAARVGRQMGDPDRLGPAARSLLDQAEARAHRLNLSQVEDVADVLGHVVSRFRNRVPRARSGDGIGPFVFFTGQLGAGGAERQMTRIAAAFQDRWATGARSFGPHRLLAPPRVCVRHATASSGADFFLPVLQDSGVQTTSLADLPLPEVADLATSLPDLAEVLPLLPEDLQQNTLKLVPYFRSCGAEIAYLWQDGGVLTAALAALLAGVPRIVTSFRGLPPSLRPELMRPQMPMLYRELARVPGVSFTANSQTTATAYEDWLALPKGFVRVIHNAVPVPAATGAADDHRIWAQILAASPGCGRTVLGIFRFDHNKRPQAWVGIAADHARANPDTRFVILGAGVEHGACRRLVAEKGLQDRIFLPGTTHHVGFYLHRADLVMHLARHEGLPNVLIEAQLAGRPVLATPAGGTAEVVRHNETGVILPETQVLDHGAILAALDSLLSDRARLARMGAAARSHSAERFLLDRTLAATLSIFDAQDQGDLHPCELS